MTSPTAATLRRINHGLRWALGVAAATAVVMLVSLEPSPGPTSSAPAVDPATADDEGAAEPFALGAQVYADNCATCHGAIGEGQSGPRLTGVINDAYPDDADLVALILTGRVPMPPFAGQLDDTEIESVIFYLRQQFG
ncbi:MAG: cytochrome c [Actinomycetota bacterium]